MTPRLSPLRSACLEQLFRNSEDAMAALDGEQRVLEVNQAFTRLFGYPREEAVGQRIDALIVPPFLEKESRQLEAHLRQGKKTMKDTVRCRKNGFLIDVSIVATPIFIKQKLGGFYVVYRDTSEPKAMERALASSQKLLKDILQGSPIATYVINMDHRIVYWNKAMERLTGRKSSEMLETDKHWEVFYPKKRSMIVDFMVNGLTVSDILKYYQYMDVERSRIEGGIVGSVFFPRFYGGGKWLRFLIKPLYDLGGRMIGAIEMAEDISRRKTAEDALRERLREMECLYRVVDATRMTLPLPHVLNGIARTLVKALRYPKIASVRIIFDERFYGHRSVKKSPYEYQTPLRINNVRRGRIILGYPKKMWKNSTAFLPEERALLRGIAQIVSKHIERRQIIELQKKFVQKSIVGICIVQNNKFVFANPEFLRIFQCRLSDTIGHTSDRFIPQSHSLYRHFKTRASRRRTFQTIIQGVRMDGKTIDLELVIQVVDHHGKPGFLGTLHDITRLKAAEARIHQFNEELKCEIAEKTRHLREANFQLRSLNRLKDEFISVASHELRSPITTIKGFLSLAQEQRFSSTKLRHYIDKAYENTEILNNLVHNILDTSLLGTGQLAIYRKEVDILVLIKNTLSSLMPHATEHSIQFRFIHSFATEQPALLMIDEMRMRQVLRNLLDNAIKFSPPKKTITVRLEKAEARGQSWIKIIVQDQGVGITKQDFPIIFDKFASGKDTRKQGKWGSGLGLYVVKEVIELHGGFIEVESRLGKGSMFSIFLPAHV